ncbi:MAG TPA: hypothetical protein VHT68_06295 [Pseudolabrys sp.]|nr:hypothetical protein [Pseudolabrys sp.]
MFHHLTDRKFGAANFIPFQTIRLSFWLGLFFGFGHLATVLATICKTRETCAKPALQGRM